MIEVLIFHKEVKNLLTTLCNSKSLGCLIAKVEFDREDGSLAGK